MIETDTSYDLARDAWIVYERENKSDDLKTDAQVLRQLHPDETIVIHHLDGTEQVYDPLENPRSGKRTLIQKGKLVEQPPGL